MACSKLVAALPAAWKGLRRLEKDEALASSFRASILGLEVLKSSSEWLAKAPLDTSDQCGARGVSRLSSTAKAESILNDGGLNEKGNRRVVLYEATDKDQKWFFREGHQRTTALWLILVAMLHCLKKDEETEAAEAVSKIGETYVFEVAEPAAKAVMDATRLAELECKTASMTRHSAYSLLAALLMASRRATGSP